MDPETQKDAQDTITTMDENAIRLRAMQAELQEIAQKIRALDDQVSANAPTPTPKGFIEVTIPTEKKDKVLIAVRTIGSIRPIDWLETPRASISFKDDFILSTESEEQEVLESYDELKQLLNDAS